MSLKLQSVISINFPDEDLTNEQDIELRSLISCKLRCPPLLLKSESPVDEEIWHRWKERCDLSVSDVMLEHAENKTVLTLVVELMNLSSSLFEIKTHVVEIFCNVSVSWVSGLLSESLKISE